MRLLAIVAVAALASQSAAADPLELAYRVEAKPWKTVRSDTAITLQLYRNQDCTDLYEELPLTAGAVATAVQIKRLVPKGLPKKPAMAELRFSLTVNDPPPNVFLRVTGSGITPFAGFECQGQVGGGNAAWHWITAEEEIISSSPSLSDTEVTRLVGSPVGRYCLDIPSFPNGPVLALQGIVGSLQVTFPGYVIRVNTVNNNGCNSGGQGVVLVSIDQLSGGAFVPANAAYTLMVPGGATVQPN
jgi:hypothetical protein